MTKTITINFPATSLNEIRKKNPELFWKSQTWYDNQAFADEIIPAGTWTVALEAAPDSVNKTWTEQQDLLKDKAEVPPAAVLVYALVEHFEKTGDRCLSDVYVRTSSRDSDGDHVYVGSFDAEGLYVDGRWGGSRVSDIGLAVAWKGETGALENLNSFEDRSLEFLWARIQKLEEWKDLVQGVKTVEL